MKRKIIQEEIYCKYFEYQYDVRFKDIPKDVQENDIIIIQNEEAHYSSNESNDGYTALVIYREREENDEEYNKRINKKKTHEETIEATNNTEVPHYLCPTQSLLQKWLRDEHNIHIKIDYQKYIGGNSVVCYYVLLNDEYILEEIMIDDIKDFKTYEEALECGLQEGLKLIKNEE